jgi:hypothetical protein
MHAPRKSNQGVFVITTLLFVQKSFIRSYFCFLLLLLNIHATAQKTFTLKDLFEQHTFIWYGIDYSHTSFVGNFAGKDLRDYYHGWNRLPVEESKKYNVARSLHKVEASFDIDGVEQINWKTEPNISDTDSLLTKTEIANMVANYQGKQQEGIGLVLMAESYNKELNVGSHYAVVFDIASKKVLISQRFSAPPGGLGIRNFWGFSIYNALNMLSDSYTKWKRKYGK